MTPFDFIILCTPRTGSSGLVHLLRSHIDIKCYDELFAPLPNNSEEDPSYRYVEYYKSSRLRRIQKILLNKYSVNSYLNTLESSHQKVTGFKIMYEHYVKYSGIAKTRHLQGCKIIYLSRINILKQVVSFKHAIQTDIWNSSSKMEFRPIRLTNRELIRLLSEFENSNARIKNIINRHQAIEVQYEKLYGDESKQILNQICDFLNVNSSSPLSNPFKKIMSENLEEIIENYDEVRGYLKGTKYEKFLHSYVANED